MVSVVMVFLSRNVLLYIFEAFAHGIYQNLEDISQKNFLISQILWLLWNIIFTVHDNFFLIKSLSSDSEINDFISKFNSYIKNSSLSTEECISLFISIREICLRRHFSNKDTYIAFLDLKKAYDTVPTYNILTKIKCLGIELRIVRKNMVTI